MPHESPYPGPPPKTPKNADWYKTVWQGASRVCLFAVGATLVFIPDGTDVQVTAGAGLMLASAGLAIAKGLK